MKRGFNGLPHASFFSLVFCSPISMTPSVASVSLPARLWMAVNRTLRERRRRTPSFTESAPTLRAMIWTMAAALAFVVFTGTAEAQSPIISSITPGTGLPTGGAVVTLYGAFPSPDVTVSFGSIVATILASSQTTIIVTSPTSTHGIVSVTVTDTIGTSNGVPFTFGEPGNLEIVSAKDHSRSDGPGTGNGFVSNAYAAVSADGRYVAFLSSATDLVLGQSTIGNQVFLRDRLSGTTQLLSGSSGTAGSVSISADGRSGVFTGSANGTQVYLYRFDNVGYGSITLVSHQALDLNTGCASGASSPMISRDGSTVVFSALGTDLVFPYTAGASSQGYRYDVASGLITLATPKNGTVASATGINAAATLSAISDDGRWIGFTSNATNALSSNTAAGIKFFLFDAVNGTTRLLNRQYGTLATKANGNAVSGGGISSDGRYVAFVSWATDLILNQASSGNQIYLYDRVGDTITLISHSVSSLTTGAIAVSSLGNTTLGLPVISGDGRFVVFSSAAVDLVSNFSGGGGGNGGLQYYLYDRLGNLGEGSVTLITHTPESFSVGSFGGIVTGSASVSADGSRVVFASDAADLVSGVTDSNLNYNIYAYTTDTHALTFVSGTAVDREAGSTSGGSFNPVVSGDGTFIAFRSFASDLADNDINGTYADLFGYTEFQVGVPTLVSGNTVAYTEAGSASALDANLDISNLGRSTLASASISISAGFLAGDTLNFVDQNGITASYNSETGVLTLTGSASRANYQAALRSITFSSTSHDPTNSGANLSRTIAWVVNDGTADSAAVTSTVNITAVNDAPTFVGATATLDLNQDASATSIVSILHASDPDGGQTLTWSQNSAPSHGSLSFSSATASTPGADLIPGGTITYTPTSGYAGSDSFSVQVGDRTVTATRTITVSVNSPFIYATSDNSISITGYNTIPADGVVVIPDTIDGNPVTSIADHAFDNCAGLISVTLPNSVTSIGESAFDSCSNLTNVTMGNSVISLGNYAFVRCTSLTNITIPASVISIGISAFEECSSLISVTLSNNVTSIGDYAFVRCTSLTSAILPDSATSIGANAFADCTSLIGPVADSVDVPANGTYGAGQNLDFTLHFLENTFVTGTPSIGVTVGSTARAANYISGNGTHDLRFRYTIQVGESDTNGIASPSSFTLNGGTIQNRAGVDASLTFNTPSTTGVLVDTLAPQVISVTRKTPLAQALATNTAVFEVTFSKDVSPVGVSSFAITPVNGSSISGVVSSVSGGPSVYTVTVTLSGGTGGFRLNVIAAPMAVSQFASGFAASYGMTADSTGNLYVAVLSTGTIRRIAINGAVSTYASGFAEPRGVVFDSAGNLFVANTGANNIRKVTPGGVVTTFASGFSSPTGLAVDSADNLYVASSGSTVLNRVTPLGVVSTFASGLSSPWGLAIDGAGNLFVGDLGTQTVRKVTSSGVVSTFATGLSLPIHLAFDRTGLLYVANAGDGTIKQITAGGVVSTVAMVSGYPSALAFGDAGTLCVLEYFSGKVFKLTTAQVKDAAGNELASLPFTSGEVYTRVAPAIASITRKTPLTQVIATNTAVFEVTYSLPVTGVVADIFTVTAINGSTITGIVTSVSGGPAVYQVTVQLTSGAGDFRLDVAVPSLVATVFAAGFSNPSALAFDSAGDLYVSNYDTNTISKVTSGGAISNFASGFNGPTDLAFDAMGTLYVANNGDGSVSQVNNSGNVSTFVTGLAYPMGLAFDSVGNLFVSTAEDNAVWSLAIDGSASLFASSFNNPNALAFDSNGNLYVANQGDNSVSKVTSGGISWTSFTNSVAGADGLAFESSGNLYVANNFNNTVSKLTSDGSLSTYATGIKQPTGLAFDSEGRLYVASQADGTVTRLAPLAPIMDLFGIHVSSPTYTLGESYTYALNVAPTDITLSNSTVGQSGGANATVGTLTTTDANGLDTHTYALVSGTGSTNNASFNLSGSTLRANDAAAVAAGNYSVRVETNDGNGGTFSKAFALTVLDDVAPAAPSTPDLATASDTGISNTDNITGVSTPTFTGTAEANSTVRFYRGSFAPFGSTTTNAQGIWTFTIASPLADGVYLITAVASDAATNASVPSAALSITIDTIAPAISLQPVGGTYGAGGSFSLSVGVTDSSALGYRWYRNSDLLVDGPDRSGAATATLTQTNLSPGLGGNYSVVVMDAAGNGSASAAAVVVVNQAGQTIVFPAIANRLTTAVPFAVAATASTGLPVTFSLVSGPALLNGSMVTVTGAGTVTLRATQAGDANTAATTADRSFAVTKAAATVTLSALNAAYDGAPHAASASTVPADLTVTFTYNGNASAPVDAGSYAVVATIDDASYAGTATGTLTIAQATQTVSFDPILGRTYGALPFTVNATASSHLAVSYSLVSGPATLSSSTVMITGVGAVVVRATQAGDANTAAAFAEQSFTVGKANQAIAFDAVTEPTYGSVPFSLGANATSLLPVSFSLVSGPAILSGATVTITGAGTVVVQASQGGDDNFNPAPSVPQRFTVGKANQTVTFDALADTTYGTAALTLSALSSAHLAVSYRLLSGPATLVDNVLTLTGAGAVQVRASQAGDVDYNPAPDVDQSFLVSASTGSVTISALSATYDGAAHAVTVTTTPANLAVTTTYDAGATAPTNAGSYAVAATIVDPDYSGSATGTLVISRAAPAIVWTAPAAIAYGTILSRTQLNATADMPGTFTYTPAAGTILPPGSNQSLAVIFVPADTVNYSSASAQQTLAVNQANQPALDLSANPPTGTVGEAYTASYTGGSGTGVVTWALGTGSTAPGAAIDATTGVVTSTGAGTIVIKATKAQDANNLAANSPDFTITLVMPSAPSTPNLIAASDSGRSSTDGITRVTAPTFTGTAEAGITVRLFSGDLTALGSATADSGGNWLIAVENALRDGVYSITAKGVDARGQTGPASAALILTIDTTAPAAPALTAISGDTGASNNDQITTDNTLILSGRAGANETVTLFRNAVQVGTATAADSGAWSFDSTGTPLADGTYVFTATTTDAAGNTSAASADFPVAVDTSIPQTTPPAAPAAPIYVNGQDLDITVNFGDIVIVDTTGGIPRLVLTLGAANAASQAKAQALTAGGFKRMSIAPDTGATVYATYVSGSGTRTLTFRYIAATATAGPVVAASVVLDGGIIASAAGNNAALTLASVSSIAAVVVVPDKIDQTITFSPVGAITAGTPVVLSAAASSGLGVVFSVVSGNATIVGASFFAADTNPITLRATQAGNGTYNAVTVDQLVSNISRHAQTIDFAAITDKLLGAAAFSLTASATSSLPVAFTVLSGPVTVAGSTLTLTGLSGTATIVARQSGDAVFAAAPDVTRSFTITTNYPAAAPDGFARSVTGGTGAQTVTVSNAADFRTQAESSTASTITVIGILNLGRVPVKVSSNKTIQGSDDGSTLLGNLTLGTGVTNVVLRGLNLTDPGTTIVNGAYTDGGDALTLSGASNVFVTHVTFFDCADHAIKFINGSDNITVSWCEFYNASATLLHRTGVQIGTATESKPLHVTLHHNGWSAAVDQQMPLSTHGYVHQYNDYFASAGNASGTVVSDQSQVLSERNVYAGVANPLFKQAVGAIVTAGKIRVIGNVYTSCTGTAPDAGTDTVFTPFYSYEMLPTSDVATEITTLAGNTAGANSTDAATGTATLTGPTAAVVPGASFTLTTALSGFTATTYQWRLNNAEIAGATASTYTSANTQAANAGTYTVAIGMTSGDAVVSAPLDINFLTPPSKGGSNSGSGGGAFEIWCYAALALIGSARFLYRRLR